METIKVKVVTTTSQEKEVDLELPYYSKDTVTEQYFGVLNGSVTGTTKLTLYAANGANLDNFMNLESALSSSCVVITKDEFESALAKAKEILFPETIK